VGRASSGVDGKSGSGIIVESPDLRIAGVKFDNL
jgi:hypothetical protein